jgi:hypothetical protein
MFKAHEHLTRQWVKQKEWRGNPKLGLESWGKVFVRNGVEYAIYVYGKEGDGKNIPCYDYTGKNPDGTYDVSTRYVREIKDFSDWHYVVSNYYSGSFYPEVPKDVHEAMNMLDLKFKKEKIY